MMIKPLRQCTNQGSITMTLRVPVFVFAHDPVLQAGVESQLRGQPEVEIVDTPDRSRVAIVVADQVDDDVTTAMRGLQRNGVPRIIGVIAVLDASGVICLAEAGACGMLRRRESTTAALVHAVELADRGDGALPADLLGGLLLQVGRLQQEVLSPRGLSFSGLADREVEVLRLVADGLDTAEIAQRLSYSERTIKNVIHDVTTRLNLRNRAQAVAYVVRQGLI